MLNRMRRAVPLFLEDDTIDYIDRLSESLAHKRKASVARSDVVAWLVKQHQKKMVEKSKAKSAMIRPVAIQP